VSARTPPAIIQAMGIVVTLSLGIDDALSEIRRKNPTGAEYALLQAKRKASALMLGEDAEPPEARPV